MAVDLFGMLDNLKNSATTQNAAESFRNVTGMTIGTEKPFSKCPAGCFIYPEACTECKKYHAKLMDVLSQVENEEEYYAQFQIDPSAPQEGEGNCYFCGAPIQLGAHTCEYCDSVLDRSNTVIRVPSRECIPNPILQAEAVIYEKYHMAERYQKQKRSGGLVKGLLGMGLAMGNKLLDFSTVMSVDEVKKMASSYDISVRGYLEGLYWGDYMTLKGKANTDALAEFNKANATASRQYQSSVSNANQYSASTVQPKKSYTMMDYMEQRAKNSSPGYLGAAPGTCCGRCRYYVAYDQTCLDNRYQHPSGPNDSCGNFSPL